MSAPGPHYVRNQRRRIRRAWARYDALKRESAAVLARNDSAALVAHVRALDTAYLRWERVRAPLRHTQGRQNAMRTTTALAMILLALGLSACSSGTKSRPQPVLGAGGRAIYTADDFAVISVCDQGNLVYLTGRGDGGIAVVPYGCMPK